MGRVHGHHAPPGASGAVGAVHHKRAEPKAKPTYKVVLEEMTGKKKLKTVLSLREKPPPGYTFIPAGDPQLTNRCKKLAKDEQLTVFIVSTSKFPHEQLSTEVHRIGYHFPSSIVDQACMSLGVTLTQSGRVLQSRFAFIDDQGSSNQHQSRRQPKAKGKGKRRQASPKLDMSLSQAVIDTTAREAIKDLFPNIPLQDQKDIVGRAFQKGKGLVGTVSDLSLVRRAQLAVTAHIRHTYTDYDRLLRSKGWREARQAVQQECLDKIVQWRGDDDDDGEMADILQEVIVIPDDDDEEDEDQDNARLLREQHEISHRIEIISSDHINTRAIDYADARSAAAHEKSPSPEPNDGNAVACMGHAPPLRGSSAHYNEHRLHQMGAQRRRIWEEAVDRQRNNVGMLYATDNRPPLSAPRSFVSDHYQAQQEARLQPYGSSPAAHNLDRTSLYPKFIPLPDFESQQRRSGETGAFAHEVPQPSRHHQTSFTRIAEDPTRVFRAKGSNPSHPAPTVYEKPTFPIKPQHEDIRLVQSQGTGHEMNHAVNSPPFVSTRQHSDLILPSVEDGLPHVGDQKALWPHRHEDMNGFTQQHPDNQSINRSRALSVIYLDDPEPQIKRRKLNDQQPLEGHQPRTVLIPLDRGVEEHRHMAIRPGESRHYQRVDPLPLDERIIQLPSRDARRYAEEDQRRIRVRIPHAHNENLVVPQVSSEGSHSRHVNSEVLAQPQSPKYSIAFQSVHDQHSPISFTASVPSYRETFHQRPLSRHVSNIDKGSASGVSHSYAMRNPLQHFDDAGRDMRAHFRNLEINPMEYRDHGISMDGRPMNNGSVINASSQAPSTTYLSGCSQADTSLQDRRVNEQMPMNDNSFELRPTQQQHSFRDRVAEPHIGRVPVDSQYTSRRADSDTMNPSKNHSAASMANITAVQWNCKRHFGEASSMNHPGNELPQTRVNTGHTGNENSRPRTQPYKDPPQVRRRVPGEIVVLD